MLDRWIAGLLLGGVVSSLFSIFVSGLLFGIAACLWLVDSLSRRTLHISGPPFFPWLALLMGWTAVSVVFSSEPLTSALFFRKQLKFLYVLLFFTYLGREHLRVGFTWIFAVLGASALYGVGQYFLLESVDLLSRIDGFMSHWMTFSGQLMLGAVALTAFLLFGGFAETGTLSFRLERRDGRPTGEARADALTALLPAAVLLMLFALLLTQTRSAVLGFVAGGLLLLGLSRKLLAAAAIPALASAFFLLPEAFQERFYSAFDPDDTTNRVRIELLETGGRMIRGNFWTGVGPRMVSRVFEDYRGGDEFPDWAYQHLHNNPVQIAAELGFPALVFWLVLWISILCQLARRVSRFRHDPFGRSVHLAAAAAVVAFLLAGLFEYNFGDSEIAILLLFIVTAPYVLQPFREALSESSRPGNPGDTRPLRGV